MSDKTISPEIVKLMDKMTQNPTSRLFVPLAEEYLKCQMVDEAVIVLVEGIKNHPNYVAARVMLGKIYLQRNQIPEAQAEFEQVIVINPDNILAHKKLAMIYQGQGQSQRALEACKKVLMIDPSDKEAKGLVGALEKASTFSVQSDVEVPSNPPVAAEPGLFNETGMKSDPVSAIESTPVIEASSAEAPIEMPLPPEEKRVAPDDSWEGDKTVVAGFEISSSGVDASSADKESKKEDPLLSTTLASLYMSQGHYQEAADVYQKLLARDPSDEESRQGFEKALRFLTSKQGAEQVSQERSGPDHSTKKKAQRLQSWLDSIRKKNEP